MTVKRDLKENSVEAALVARVRAAGGICEKVTVIGARGFFDRVVILPGGRVIFCELKRPQGGRLSPHQKARHAAYRALGAEVALIKNSEQIDKLLSAA
jgi:hypothetical protein